MLPLFLAQFRTFASELGQFLPTLASAAGLLLLGWLVALLLRVASRRGTERVLRRVGRDTAVERALETSGVRPTIARLVGGFVFWLVLLLFLAAAIETLGLPVLSSSLRQVTHYLPNVLAGVLIVVGGLVVGKLAGGGVITAASTAGIARAATLGRAVQTTILLVAIVVGLEQIGIRGQLFVVIVAVIFATFLGGAGIAFGLGARTAVSNIIASHYASQAYRPGQMVRIGAIQGRVVETTPTAVVVHTDEGRVHIPAMRFSEETSILLTEAS